MKARSKFAGVLPATIITLLVMTASSGLIAQDSSSTDLKEFKITIVKSKNGVKLQSEKGTAWIDLSFSSGNYKPMAIDEYGMTQIGKVDTGKDPKLADFLFTITRTNEGITLTGIEGTAWKELSFSLEVNGSKTIDQIGMTD